MDDEQDQDKFILNFLTIVFKPPTLYMTQTWPLSMLEKTMPAKRGCEELQGRKVGRDATPPSNLSLCSWMLCKWALMMLSSEALYDQLEMWSSWPKKLVIHEKYGQNKITYSRNLCQCLIVSGPRWPHGTKAQFQ